MMMMDLMNNFRVHGAPLEQHRFRGCEQPRQPRLPSCWRGRGGRPAGRGVPALRGRGQDELPRRGVALRHLRQGGQEQAQRAGPRGDPRRQLPHLLLLHLRQIVQDQELDACPQVQGPRGRENHPTDQLRSLKESDAGCKKGVFLGFVGIAM